MIFSFAIILRMLHIQHLHTGLHFWHHYKKELRLMYFSMSLRIFAINLAIVFVPIYVFQLGFSFQTILLFYLVHFLTRIPGDIVAGYFIARRGVKPSMVIGILFMILYLALLLYLQFNSSFSKLMLASFFSGLETSFFFIAYHINFSKIKLTAQAGRQLGLMAIIIAFAASIAPIVGGLLINSYGIVIVFGLIILLLLLAAFILLKSKESTQKRSLRFKNLRPQETIKSGLQFGVLGLDHFNSSTLWPLFIFFVVFNENPYVSIGAVTSASLLFTIATDYGMGRLIDRGDAASIKRTSALFTALLYGLKQFATSFTRVLLVNLSALITGAGMVLARTTQFYGEADQGTRIEYIMMTETVGSILKSIFLLLVLILSYSYDPIKTIAFSFLFMGILMLPLIIWNQALASTKRNLN
jgi:MFS family permease